jgi:hypothetical protein
MDGREMSQAIEREIEQDARQISLDEFGGDNNEVEELGINHKGAFDRNDYLRAYDDVVRNPSFNGFDTQFKLAVLFRAVQNEMEEDGQLQLRRCGACEQNVSKNDFAKEFVDAYGRYMADTKTSLAKETAKTLYTAVKKNWISVIKNIVADIVPIVERYLKTNPKKLNSVDDFPYVIKEGVIYHDRCFEN